MSRREVYLEAMLRNLGAEYYQVTQGTARAADVATALQRVRDADGGGHGRPTAARSLPSLAAARGAGGSATS